VPVPPAAWHAEPWCRDGVLLSTTKQNGGAAFSPALGNTSRNASLPRYLAVEVRAAWLPSMARAGLNLGGTVFHLPSRVDGK